MGRDHCIVVDTSDFSSKKQGGSPVQKRLESRTKGEGITMEDIEKSLLEAEGRRAEIESMKVEKAKGKQEVVSCRKAVSVASSSSCPSLLTLVFVLIFLFPPLLCFSLGACRED